MREMGGVQHRVQECLRQGIRHSSVRLLIWLRRLGRAVSHAERPAGFSPANSEGRFRYSSLNGWMGGWA